MNQLNLCRIGLRRIYVNLKERRQDIEDRYYIDKFPLWEFGKNKGEINWEKCVGNNYRFIYDKISNYLNIKCILNDKVEIIYDNQVYLITKVSLSKCNIGNIIYNRSKDFKLQINTKINNLIVTDRKYIKNKNGRNYKYYKYTCNICGWTDGLIEESNLMKGTGCSCCAGKTVVEGINDIPTTAPWMIPYFQGGYDEAKLYTKSSHSFIYPICPDCGRVKDKKNRISNIYNSHSNGCICSDGISYPEKYVYNFLKQINFDFIYQLTKRNLSWCDKYKYDFSILSKSCIIEVNGEGHYKGFYGYNKARSLDDEIKNDLQKESLAKYNGIINYITINAEKSESQWIKNSIMNSELPKLLNFKEEDINWLQCHEFALSNIIKQVCDYRRQYTNISVTKIGDHFKLSDSTIRKYLKIGNEIGWCSYDILYELEQRNIKISKINKRNFSKQVVVFKDDKIIGIFNSISELERISMNKFGIKFTSSGLSLAARNANYTYKGYKIHYLKNGGNMILMKSNIEDIIKCINAIIEENCEDVYGDNESDYSKLRNYQNEQLNNAIFYLEGIIDPTHGYAE